MKKTLAVLFLLNTFALQAQIYERGKKNFFLEPGVYASFSNLNKSAFTGNQTGISYGLTGGKLFMDFFRVGLAYQYHQHQYPLTDALTTNLTRHYAGLRADIKMPLFRVYLGKSKHYECTVLHSHLFIGPEYGMGFGGNIGHSNTGEFLLNAAYGIQIKKSGSSKKQAAYDFYVMLNMKKALNPYLKVQNVYGTYWGISFMLIKYRTGKWT